MSASTFTIYLLRMSFFTCWYCNKERLTSFHRLLASGRVVGLKVFLRKLTPKIITPTKYLKVHVVGFYDKLYKLCFYIHALFSKMVLKIRLSMFISMFMKVVPYNQKMPNCQSLALFTNSFDCLSRMKKCRVNNTGCWSKSKLNMI